MSKEQGLQSILVRSFSSRQTLDCGAHAGSVYEGEHVVQTLVGGTDELAFRVLKIDFASGGTVAAHLVFDATDGCAIELACDVAIVAGLEFGDGKEGDAARAFRSARQAGENAVNDVVCEVVLAAADENFRARDLVLAVADGLGFGLDKGQV